MSPFLWILVFYYIPNFYLNSVVAYEIHGMALKSFRRKKSKAPSPMKVCVQSSCAYLISGLLTCWMLIQTPWALMTIDESEDIVTTYKFGSPSSNHGGFD